MGSDHRNGKEGGPEAREGRRPLVPMVRDQSIQMSREQAEKEQQRYLNRLEHSLQKMTIPDKDILMIMTGKDRQKTSWRECEAWRELSARLRRTPRPGAVVLSGEFGTGKTSAACLALVMHCRYQHSLDIYRGYKGPETETRFRQGIFVAAADYIYLSREKREAVKAAPAVVLDDLGDEGSEDWKNTRLRHFFSSRDRYVMGPELTLITCNFGPACSGSDDNGLLQFKSRYGGRALERLSEWGLEWCHCTERVRRPRGKGGEE